MPTRDPRSVFARVLAQTVRATNGCLEWQGGRIRTGYGRIKAGRRDVYVHRVVFEGIHGSIAEGMEIDHLCRNRACVEISHLEAVTHAENNRRVGAARTHCRNGHPRTEENRINARYTPGEFRCRLCNRDTVRRCRERQRSAQSGARRG